MATALSLCSAIIFTSLLGQCSAAVIPDNVSSATGNSRQEMTTHELDLANLSLPPEVITEALFSQTDFLQDQLEQCEEMVRNNLHGDDTAETDGLDNDDDEDNGDINRKIAQLAVDAFSHSTNTNFDVDNDDETSRKTDMANGDKPSEDNDLNNKIGTTNLVGKGTDETDNISDEKDDDVKEGEVEYVVYNAQDDENSDGKTNLKAENKDPHKDEKQENDKSDDQEDSEHESETDKDKEEGDENEEEEEEEYHHHHQNSETPTEEQEEKKKEKSNVQNQRIETDITATQTQAQQSGTTDSDADEPQAQPAEADISNIITNSSSNNENVTSEDSVADAHQDPVHQKETTEDQTSINDTKTTLTTTPASQSSVFQDSQALTTSKVKPAESSKQKTARPKSKLLTEDNDSEESRPKRSLSLDQVVLNNGVERRMPKDIQKVILGKGRIRRQVSPREELKSWFLNHVGNVEEESPVDIHDTIKMAEKSLNLDVLKMEEKSLAGDVLKMARKALIDDVINMAVKSPAGDVINLVGKHHRGDDLKTVEKTFTHKVIKMAEKFLQTHKPFLLPHSSRPRKPDLTEMEHLLVTLRNPPKMGQIRRRRNVSPSMSPDRYVPLIDQLVERMKYLQHSVRVCHMLLPASHVPTSPSGNA